MDQRNSGEIRRIATSCAIACLLVTPHSLAAAAAAWEAAGRGMTDADIRVVAADPRQPSLLYAASEQTVYASRDGGRSWQASWQAAAGSQIAFMAVDPFDGRRVLAATDRGLEGSSDGGTRWQRLFRGLGEGESRCQAVAFDPVVRGRVLLGTAGGMFESRDGGSQWKPVGAGVSGRSIHYVAIDPREPTRTYALSDRGLLVSHGDLERWERLAVTLTAEETLEETDGVDSSEAPVAREQFTAVAIDPKQPERLYLAGRNGLLLSDDRGRSWTHASQTGPGGLSIRHLILQAHSPSVVYAATPDGVAEYHTATGRWQMRIEGLPSPDVHFLAASGMKLYAATSHGLYALDLAQEQLSQGDWPGAQALLSNFVHEPTIGQSQEAAVRYAEVHPKKIAHWRRQAALKALLPGFGIDYDRDEDTYVTSIGSTTNPTFDRILSARDPSNGWRLSVDWDLGDLIWNNAQTSIDTRSKLMVELRDDILNEVTRAFFERRRVQMELLMNPPADPKREVEQELKLQELTARLDGLTGGWFSERIDGNTHP